MPTTQSPATLPPLVSPTNKLPIGADWIATANTIDIRFPYTGETVAIAGMADAAAAEAALTAAAAARKPYAATTTAQRVAILEDIHARVKADREKLIEILIYETGKPRRDCTVEVDRTLVTLRATCEEASRIHGETVSLDLQELGRGMIGYYTRKPAGVVVGIAGFNYPLLLATHKLAPALAAGCPVIIKPAPHTPLATLELLSYTRDALAAHGAPVAAAQLINGDAEIGQQLITDPRCQVVSFTGSAKIGHLIAKQAAPRRVALELGSNTGFIVAADADLDAAVDAVLRGAFYANGQACISVQRVLLVREIAEQFTKKLLARLPEIKYGDPRDPAVHVAPVINAASGERIRSWIAAAAEAGAKVLLDGRDTGSADPAALAPSVLADVPESCDVWAEEIFGPALALRTVESVAEAIAVVNNSRYGLQAAIYTASLEAAFAAIEQLEVGGVVVNEIPGFRSDIMPYGGVKDSGIGREGPRFAIEEFTVTRMAMIRPKAREV